MRTPDILRLMVLVVALAAWSAANAAEPAPEAADPPDTTESTAEAREAAPKASDPGPDEAASQPTAEDLFKQGRDALYQGQYQQAIELLGKAVAADETKTNYRLHLARACRYAGKEDDAAKHLREILKAAPDHVEAGQALAEVHAAGKHWTQVVHVLEPLLKYRHDYPTYHMLAEAEYNLDQHEKARKHYEEAVKLNPQSASDRYQLGNIYLSSNFFALAAQSYQSALRLGLDSPVLRYKLGSAYFNLRNYFGQITVQTIKSGATGEINGRWYLIEPVPDRKDVFRCAPEASAIYQIAKAVADGIEDRPDIKVLRATIYLNARRYGPAYKMFTEISPTVPEEDKALFHYYYAQAAFGTGRYDEYLKLLQGAIRLDPEAYQAGLVEAYLQVADQYNQEGQLNKYIEYLAQAVAESPQTASLHLKLGYAYEEDQKYDQAIAQWRMVLDLEPDHGDRMKLLNLIEKHRAGVTVSVGPGETKETETPQPDEPAAEGQ